MPKLISMKLSDAERKDAEVAGTPDDAPRYPWGLQVRLEDDELEKLGITALPNVGDEQLLVATVKVTSVSERDDESGTTRSVGLQITDMHLETESPDAKRKATMKALYGEGDKA